MTKAEQELGALFSAVKELFGSAQAKLSAEDWLHELTAMNRLVPVQKAFLVPNTARCPRRGLRDNVVGVRLKK